jgi:hypothetical protein
MIQLYNICRDTLPRFAVPISEQHRQQRGYSEPQSVTPANFYTAVELAVGAVAKLCRRS